MGYTPPQGGGRGGLSWEQIKFKLEEEGSLNKKYDADLDGVDDLAASHASRHEAGGADEISNLTIVSVSLVLDTGKTWNIPANHHVVYVLGPGQSLSGSDTIQGEGSLILFEL